MNIDRFAVLDAQVDLIKDSRYVALRRNRQIFNGQLVERYQNFHLCRDGLHHLIVRDKPMPCEVPFIRFHQIDDMPYSSIDEGGEFSGSFLGVLGAGIVTGEEFAWDDPVGAREGDRRCCHSK